MLKKGLESRGYGVIGDGGCGMWYVMMPERKLFGCGGVVSKGCC